MKALQNGKGITLYTGRPHRNISYRNRYRIATANGPLLLSIPVRGGRRSGATMADTPIDYTHGWQRQHWGALYSAYGRAPFYEHFGPELEALIFAGHKSLLDFNLAGIQWLSKSMRLEQKIIITTEWSAEMEEPYDQIARPEESAGLRPYHQVFEDRFGFLPDLSVIDVLMSEGPYAKSWLI